MTEQLTIRYLNCGNCLSYTTTPHPISSKDIHYCGKERISEYQKHCTEHKGCASHPLALQVLAGPVIAELDAQATTAMNELTHKNIEQDSYRIGLDEGCRNAIKLLKGEKP